MKSTVFLIASALAHFDIRQPTPRVQNLDEIKTSPCGLSAQGSRQPFPIVGGVIKIIGYHRRSTATFKLSLSTSPQTNQDFGFEIAPSMYRERSGPFETLPLDLSKIPGVVNGSVGTIQVVTKDNYESFQCIDVVFQGAVSVPTSIAPVPVTTASSVAKPPVTVGTATATATATATTTTSTTPETPATTQTPTYEIVSSATKSSMALLFAAFLF